MSHTTHLVTGRLILVAVRVAIGVGYPFFVYFFHDRVAPLSLVGIGAGLIAINLIGLRRGPRARLWLAAGIAAILVFGALGLAAPVTAVKLYPIVNGLLVALLFALSLLFPPNLIERFARMTTPDLPPKGVAYTRKVAIAWIVLLLVNAAISAALAIWGTIEAWTIWNGILVYVVMGLMFAGEFCIRQIVRREHQRQQ